MKIFLDTGVFAAYLLPEVRDVLEKEFAGIKDKKDTLCITPLVLEEFSHTLLYKIGSDTGIFDQLGGNKTSRPERIKHFFDNYGAVLQTLLLYAEHLDVPKQIGALLADKQLLETLTADVRTMDLLHVLSAAFLNTDVLITSDSKLFSWVQGNIELFKGTIQKDFLFVHLDLKTLKLEQFKVK